MVLYIILGCLAFIFFVVFDINKIFFQRRLINASFLLGILLLLFCTAVLLANSDTRDFSAWQILAAGFCFLSLLLLFYTLFWGIPFKKTYMKVNQGNAVVNAGMYALCRHPGVIWFFFFYLLLGMALNNKLLMTAAFVWTILDIVYVYIQDRWIFPIILKDYQTYQQHVPFLIPNTDSFHNCISSYYERS